MFYPDFFQINELPVIGAKVPDCEFEIYHANKIKKVKLSSFQKSKKWTVLFFYPADFTFICPTELEDMANAYSKLKKLGVEVVSVSTDTAFSHKAWHDNSPAIKKIKFPMAADPTGTLTKMFGVYIEDEGLALRGTFIIDPKGILKAYEVHDNSIGRNVDELIRKIQAAQFVEKNKGQVCPASWTPGKKTLKPGVELVGKL
ncbi:MAG: redoxin domain-containing protein [Candidatus Moranbacteria bacterium]|nr:redoxin domain-containing protein [Candidatus Moranbacteria bacterium]